MAHEPSHLPSAADDLAEQVAARFAAEFGQPSDGVFTAPGRVNLIGEHLDYNGGRCLPFALPYGSYVASATRDDDVVRIHSEQLNETWTGSTGGLGPGSATGWVSYAAGAIWSLREDGFAVPGLDLLVDSRVPIGAGLSSSAALECSIALAACSAAGVQLDEQARHRVVTACIRAENEVAGAATGGLDQTVAMFASEGHALLLDFAAGTSRQVPLDPGAHDLELVVVDTRVSHSLSDDGYASRRRDCEAAAAHLGVDLLATVPLTAIDALADAALHRRARHVVTEQRRVDEAVTALEAGDMQGLGHLLSASHASLRDDFEVSCPELDVACETAVDAGALGARMTGGGFGGSAIALVPRDLAVSVRQAIEARFVDRGWRAPAFLAGVPSPGARRLTGA